MLHLRLVAPPALTGNVLDLLDGDPAVTNVVLLSGAGQSPAGDVVLADVAREGATPRYVWSRRRLQRVGT